jgi:magnesium chelatase family protein
VALVGGGGKPRPGEIPLAHNGVLFLDELPEFDRSVLEVLREPMESGSITISRAAQQAEFPARFQLIAAMNPCPCGYLGDETGRCRCTAEQVGRYRSRLSGPLLDRIDLHVEVPRQPLALGQADLPPGEASKRVARRVARAIERQLARQGRRNHALDVKGLERHARPDPQGRRLLQQAIERLGSPCGPITASSRSRAPSPIWRTARGSMRAISARPSAIVAWIDVESNCSDGYGRHVAPSAEPRIHEA